MVQEWLVEVSRFDPEYDTARVETYRVPQLDKMTVLDALAYIQRSP